MMYKNRPRDGGRAGSCYWVTVALDVDSSTDPNRACVFAIADFTINPARLGTQTHMDLIDSALYRDCEPMATMANNETVKSVRRLMG